MHVLVDVLRDLPPAELLEVAGLLAAVEGERHGLRPFTAETMAKRIGAPQAATTTTVVRAKHDTGELCGIALIDITTAPTNQHIADLFVGVAPEHRRSGLGRELLAEAAKVADAAGRSLLVGASITHAPAGAAFAEAVGFDQGLVLRLNHLQLADVDRSMLEAWVKDAEGGDYDLLWVDGRVDDDLIDEVVAVGRAMNDAPHDDLDVEDEETTPAMYRDWETSSMAAGFRRWAYYAQHRETKVLAGWSNVRLHPEQPEVVQQGGTGVLPAHRGHRLGRWLKAAMLLKILEELPEAVEVRTDNAHTNDHMLAINDALGFLPAGDEVVWQAKTAAFLAGHP